MHMWIVRADRAVPNILCKFKFNLYLAEYIIIKNAGIQKRLKIPL